MSRPNALVSTAGPGYTGGDRDSTIAEALARLGIATELRHTSGAARVLDELAGTATGTWLLAQMAAAGLRALSTGIQTLPTADAHFGTCLTPEQ